MPGQSNHRDSRTWQPVDFSQQPHTIVIWQNNVCEYDGRACRSAERERFFRAGGLSD
jgi:hypothetical protein